MEINDLLNGVMNGDFTIRAALESAYDAGKIDNLQSKTCENDHILLKLYGQKNVFIRTVTHHYTGKLLAVIDGFLVLSFAAWIADDGRFSDAIKTGILGEVEPYFDDKICVAIGAIIDGCEWKHELPRVQK
jgi:hypothetical protein